VRLQKMQALGGQKTNYKNATFNTVYFSGVKFTLTAIYLHITTDAALRLNRQKLILKKYVK
jgi:hypothetical protein